MTLAQAMVQCVRSEAIENYGVADLGGEESKPSKSVDLKVLVEKPSPTDAPSKLTLLGRYILPSEMLDVLKTTVAGIDGGIKLTD